MDLHIKAYNLNHWFLSLYGFQYLHYSVTLLSQGETHFLVFSQTLIYMCSIHSNHKQLPCSNLVQIMK